MIGVYLTLTYELVGDPDSSHTTRVTSQKCCHLNYTHMQPEERSSTDLHTIRVCKRCLTDAAKPGSNSVEYKSTGKARHAALDSSYTGL